MGNMLANTETQNIGGILRNLFENEVAKLLGVSRTTLKSWRKSGKIKYHKNGDNTSPVIYEAAEVERIRLERIAAIESKRKAELEEINLSVYDFLAS